MPAVKEEQPVEVYYEDLAALEQDFDDVELEILKHQYALNKPLYRRREALLAKIPNFWALVFEQCPPELDQFIQPSDSKLFAECLKSISVDRFEIDDPKGSPRSFMIKFEFTPNDYFEDTELVKKFWYRRAHDNWTGLVSEPVQIRWKKGKDLTKGLTSAAVKLWEARHAQNGAANGKGKESELPEHKALLSKLESAETDAALSFFTWFAWASSRPYVTAEESAAANAAEAERRERRKKGEKVTPPEDNEDLEWDETLEIHPGGEDIANLIAEDLWPHAIKYFIASSEQDDEELSEMDEDFDDEDSDEEVDIRALVGKGRNGKESTSPPAKKRRT